MTEPRPTIRSEPQLVAFLVAAAGVAAAFGLPLSPEQSDALKTFALAALPLVPLVTRFFTSSTEHTRKLELDAQRHLVRRRELEHENAKLRAEVERLTRSGSSS